MLELVRCESVACGTDELAEPQLVMKTPLPATERKRLRKSKQRKMKEKQFRILAKHNVPLEDSFDDFSSAAAPQDDETLPSIAKKNFAKKVRKEPSWAKTEFFLQPPPSESDVEQA